MRFCVSLGFVISQFDMNYHAGDIYLLRMQILNIRPPQTLEKKEWKVTDLILCGRT